MQIVCCERFGPPADLERIEQPVPEPRPHEVQVKVAAAGVGFVDGLMIQGLYQVKPPLPYYPGSEFAGEISALGAEVTHLRVGQRVMGLAQSGAYADYLCATAQSVVPVPEELDDATAAGFFINYATALYGLRNCGHLAPGESVLVLGAAGGVGSAAIAVAKAMGAYVVAAASTEDKRQAALGFRADAAVDYTAPDWRDALKALLADRGLNMVYDPVGGNVAEPAFRSLSPGGRFLVVGFAQGEIPKLPLNLALLKRAAIVGVDWGGEARANPTINAELMQTLSGWIENGKLRCASVTRRPMTDFRMALEDQLAGKVVGKLVLTND